MSRDKVKDDARIDCDQVKELGYVADLYGDRKDEVLRFLLDKCEIGRVNSRTHRELYEIIEEKLGLKIPE